MGDPGRIPGPEVVPNCVQMRLVWTLANGKTAYNVMHGRVAAGFSATAAVAQAIYAAIIASGAWTSYKAHVNSGVSFAGVDLRDIRTANEPVVASTGAATPGTGAGDALPPGTALVVTERTAQAGRAFRGRIYLPGLDVGALQANGQASAATVTDATAFINEVATAMSGQGLTQCLAQPARNAYTGTKGTAHPARSAGTVDVTSNQIRTGTINSQRRRSQTS